MLSLRKRAIVSVIGLVMILCVATSPVHAKMEHVLFLVTDNTARSGLELHIVDPTSLHDLSDHEPLPMGHSYTAALSADHHTLAAIIWNTDYAVNGTLHLFNLEAWKDHETSLNHLTYANALTFSRDGNNLYWSQQADPSLRSPWSIYSYDIQQGGDAAVIAKLPVGLTPQQMRITKSGVQLVVFATPQSDTPTTSDVPEVVSVNLKEKRIESAIKLDSLNAVFRLSVGDKNGNPIIHEYNQPGLAWDLDANLLYIAHPTADRLTVVDLSTRTIAKEVDLASVKVAGHAKMMKGTERIALVNSMGDALYISTRHSDVVIPEDGKIDKAVQIQQPLGVKMIALKELKEAQQTSIPLFEMTLSPDGQHLLATGIASNQPMNGDGKITYSGVYVLDAKTLQPLKHFDTKDKLILLNGFSADSRYAYFTVDPYSYGPNSSSLRVIDLQTLELGAERSIKSGYIDVIGTLNPMTY
jgi:hypothetical protein